MYFFYKRLIVDTKWLEQLIHLHRHNRCPRNMFIIEYDTTGMKTRNMNSSICSICDFQDQNFYQIWFYFVGFLDNFLLSII